MSACEQWALCRLRIRFAISVFPHYLRHACVARCQDLCIMRRDTRRASGCDVLCLHVSTRQCMAAYNHVIQHGKQQAPLKGLLKLICFNGEGSTRRLTPVCEHEAAAACWRCLLSDSKHRHRAYDTIGSDILPIHCSLLLMAELCQYATPPPIPGKPIFAKVHHDQWTRAGMLPLTLA